jgi:hypothetical protein
VAKTAWQGLAGQAGIGDPVSVCNAQICRRVALDGPGRWIVLAGQTGGDEKGDYQPGMAGQVGVGLQRIFKLLAEAAPAPNTPSARPGI